MARILARPSSRRKRAFTLAEIIIALGLCVVALLSAIALAISATRGNQKIADLTAATALANQEMEQFVYGVPGSNDVFWTQPTFASPYATDRVQLGRTPFDVQLSLQDLSTLGSGMRMATVDVTWDSGMAGKTGYGQQSVQISRLLYAH